MSLSSAGGQLQLRHKLPASFPSNQVLFWRGVPPRASHLPTSCQEEQSPAPTMHCFSCPWGGSGVALWAYGVLYSSNNQKFPSASPRLTPMQTGAKAHGKWQEVSWRLLFVCLFWSLPLRFLLETVFRCKAALNWEFNFLKAEPFCVASETCYW